MATTKNYQALGVTFLSVGVTFLSVGLTTGLVSMAATAPAFIVLGVVFLAKSRKGADGEGG